MICSNNVTICRYRKMIYILSKKQINDLDERWDLYVYKKLSFRVFVCFVVVVFCLLIDNHGNKCIVYCTW